MAVYREPIQVDARSNCTFMELKFIIGKGNKERNICSNCTFMELKSCKRRPWNLTIARSNCTFMELKSVSLSIN